MKIAVFAHIRSGSTLLCALMWRHLRKSVPEQHFIREPFNPSDSNVLTLDDGILSLDYFPKGSVDTVQTREERFALFQQADANTDYLLKVVSQDTMAPDIVPYLMRNGYQFITLERRNALSAFLSALIADHHQVWNVTVGRELPNYKPFVVEQNMLTHACSCFARYHHWKNRINAMAHLFYEDIVEQPVETTLRQTGIYYEGGYIPDLTFRKLLSFDDKVKLIINLDEVLERFGSIATAYRLNVDSSPL